jgi:hypothetical protein
MNVRLSLLSAIMTLSIGSWFAFADTSDKAAGFTLQVAAFPEDADVEAEEFVAKLAEAGEQPVWGIVEIPGKGQWLRVFIGSFKSSVEARLYAEKLVGRRVIKQYLVKKASEINLLSRPRSVVRREGRVMQIGGRVVSGGNHLSASTSVEKPLGEQNEKMMEQSSEKPPPGNLRPPLAMSRPPTVFKPPLANVNAQASQALDKQTSRSVHKPSAQSSPHAIAPNKTPLQKAPVTFARSFSNGNLSTITAAHSFTTLPQAKSSRALLLKLAPTVEASQVPRADPLRQAFRIIANSSRHQGPLTSGGLWLSGDKEEGLERLRWIVGKAQADFIELDDDGKVNLNAKLLTEAAHLQEIDPTLAPLRMIDYLSANEGLLLLVQLTQGANRYRLHLGRKVATAGGEIVVNGSLNLDNNFDSRINPYRRLQKKMAIEMPPLGFDSLIAMNPEARWVNLYANRLVPVGNITFHELAEAHAKVELGCDYLPKPTMDGAHDIAIEREMRLKEQRPLADLVLTLGSNRMLKSEDELQRFYAETNGARQQ